MAIIYKNERDMNNNSYENRVLSVKHNSSYQVMSDIWCGADEALVWDDKENAPKRLVVNIYDMNPADWKPAEINVDASEEVKAKYRDWLTQRHFESLVRDAEDQALQFEKGSIAKVVKGKSSKGVQGKVVVMISAPYRMGYRAIQTRKLGIATSDVMIKKPLSNGKVVDAHRDMVWVWAMNCQRVDKPQIDRDALLQQARERALREYAA